METVEGSKQPNNTEVYTTYKRLLILTFEGGYLSVYITMFILFACFKIVNEPGVAFFCFAVSAFFFALATNHFYYFSFSESRFVVENQLMFWFNKTYDLNNLDQIAFERPHLKSPNRLRIITKDFDDSAFFAASLSDRQWIALKEQFENQNVTIEDQFVKDIVFFEFVLFDEIKEIFSRFTKK